MTTPLPSIDRRRPVRRPPLGSIARRVRQLRSTRGTSPATFVLMMPALVAFIELAVLGGRITGTQADVQSAAREAARQASVASGPASAATVIDDAVNDALGSRGIHCVGPTASLGPSTSYVPGGRVEVVVRCQVQLADLGFLNVPGAVTITGRALEPIDYYRVID